MIVVHGVEPVLEHDVHVLFRNVVDAQPLILDIGVVAYDQAKASQVASSCRLGNNADSSGETQTSDRTLFEDKCAQKNNGAKQHDLD